MSIERTVYDTRELLGVMREMEGVPVFWRRWFPGQFFSDKETIDWSEIPARRRLAPLVLPTVQGQPMYGRTEELRTIRPAYIKPKDAVLASSMIKRSAGFGELGDAMPMSANERFMANIAAILEDHRYGIERRWEWMAARALIDGQVTLVGLDGAYPEVTINFRRAAALTVTAAGNDLWNNANADIPKQLEDYRALMARARFGASASTALLGGDSWDAFRKNASVKEELDTRYRGTEGAVNRGVGTGERYQVRGYLGTLEIATYEDTYEDEAGNEQKYLGDKEIVMLAPPAAVAGFRAFGAIQDKAAGLRPLAMFPKMWDEDDPSATQVMTQSAPVLIPTNPNGTFKATVLS